MGNRINKKKEKNNNENLFFDFFVIYLETVKKETGNYT